jgi:FkbM family methyltransferase
MAGRVVTPTVPPPSTAPLTIAYVGNHRHSFCTERHVSASLAQIGHTVIPLQEDDLDWTQLPSLAASAHLVLWTRTWAVDDEAALAALAKLRDMRIPTVSFHLDRWWGLDREYQVTTQPFFRTDLVVSPDGANDHRWAEAGVNHLFLPPGVYGAECGPVQPNRRAFPCDVIFVGSHPYPHAEWHPYRAELLERMEAHFGRRFGIYPKAKNRPIRGRLLQQLYASAKVVVGDSCLAGGATRYWSDRVPETLGRGGLLIHPEVEGMEEWYADASTTGEGDLLCYPLGDFDRAVALAEEALANPPRARAIAEHGRATVLGRDTYAHRMNTVLAHVERHLGFGAGPLRAGAPADPGAVHRVRWKANPRQVQASFALVPGDPDNVAVWEVWTDDTYRLRPEQIRGQVVVDIGANLGAFSVLAARLGATTVHAYEPVDRVADLAAANAAANRVADRVVLHRQAVAARSGRAVLVDVAAGGAHLAASCDDGEAVDTVGINDVLGPLDAVGLLKIDCEGGEFAIVDGIDSDQLAKVAHIAMEFHGPAMPHLVALDTDGRHAERWGAMVTKLAEHGHVRTLGHPSRGGLLWWDRY